MLSFFRHPRKKGAILSFEQAAYLLVLVILIGLGTWGWNEWTDYARRDVAKQDVVRIANAVSRYTFDNDAMPNALTNLTDKKGANAIQYLPSIPKDPWGNDYHYKIDGSYFIVYTYANSDDKAGGDAKEPTVANSDDANSTIYAISQ